MLQALNYTFDKKGQRMLHFKMNKREKRVALSILLVYLTTSIHHVYGAWLYETPWRNHIAYQGFSWLLLSYLIMLIYINWKKNFLAWVFVVFAGFFFVGAIGFFEGAYNHVLKNILYFGGLQVNRLHAMYPPPKYLLPNDWIFEISGVFTFFISLWCLKTMIEWIRNLKSNV